MSLRLASLIEVTLDDTVAMAATVSSTALLDVVHLRADVAGRLRGLLGERLHLAGDHRKTAAGSAGAGRLDRGVERQQRGLRGDLLDHLHDHADARGRLREAAHDAVGAREIGRRAFGRGLGGCDLVAGAGDQSEQRVGALRDRLDVAGSVAGSLGGIRGALAHVLVAAAQIGWR